MVVNKKLYGEIEDYCTINGLDVSKTLNKALRSGFTILQFGVSPNSPKTKEVVVEVIKEVIKEVEIEVPVEKFIEVKVSDDTKVDELLIKINSLENNNEQLTNEIKRLKSDNETVSLNLVKCQKENAKLSSGGFDLYGER